MITIATSTAVAARSKRVWEALVDPAAIPGWFPVPLEPLEVAEDYPAGVARWRCRIGGVPLLMVDHPLESEPLSRLARRFELRSLTLQLGFRLDAPEGAGPLRLHCKVVAPSAASLVSGALDRFDMRGLATRFAHGAAGGVRRVCEGVRKPDADRARRPSAPRPRPEGAR